jgi:hypothetical protein
MKQHKRGNPAADRPGCKCENIRLVRESSTRVHGRMSRGGHRLPKVTPGPAMPYLSTPRGWATTETACGRVFERRMP